MQIRKNPTNKHLREYLGRLTVTPRKYYINKMNQNHSNSIDGRKSKKFMKTSFYNSSDTQNLLHLQEKIKRIYEKLIQFYQTNENKIIGIIKNELFQKSYFYGKELIQFIKSIKFMKEYIPNCNIQRFCHDLTNILEFLENFYKKKCLRQIDIIEESILQRQRAIRNITDYNSYKMISKNSRVALLGDYNIYEDFKNISDKFGRFREISPVYKALYQRMHDSERKITKIFQTTCNSKEKDKFQLKNAFCYEISFE